MAKATPEHTDQTGEPMTPAEGDEVIGDGSGHALPEIEQEPDTAETIAGPGPADATPDELAQMDNAALGIRLADHVDDPADAPQHLGYCHTGDCAVATVQLWHPAATEMPVLMPDERPHNCADTDHPHPVMCQCGNLLQPEPVEKVNA